MPSICKAFHMSLCLRLSLSGCYGLWRCLWARGKLGVKKEACWSLKGRPQLSALAFWTKFFPNRFQYVDFHVNPRVVSAIQLYEAQQISSQLQRNQTFTFSLSLSLFPFVRRKLSMQYIYIYPNTAMHATCDIFDPPPPLRTPSVCILCFRTSYTTFADIRDVYRDIPTNCELLDLHACIRLSVCLEPALSSSLPSIFGGSCSTRDWWAGLIWYEGCRSVGAGKSDN